MKATVAFSDVRRNRVRGPSDLRSKFVLFELWKPARRQPVDFDEQVIGALPCNELRVRRSGHVLSLDEASSEQSVFQLWT